MPKVRVVTDSSWDMPEEVRAQYDITVVPLAVIFGEEEFLETELTREQFWEKAAQVHPQTSQPSPGDFEAAFRRLVEAGHDVLCLTVTGKHSGTFNSATTAAAEFPPGRVAVVDSRSISWGQGFQAVAAAEWAEEGMPLDEIVRRVKAMQERLHIFILLDTLEYLERGGRAALLMPVVKRVARAFNIKPIINLVDGELTLRSAVRSYRKGMERLVEEAKGLGPLEKIAVLHVRNLEAAEALRGEVAQALGLSPDEVGVGELGAALSCHGGPGMTAIVALQAPSE